MVRWSLAVLLAFLAGDPAIAEPVGTIRVIDADTIDVGGVRVRLHGIDAPELDQPCRLPDGRDWACGRWARDEVRKRYGGRRAVCEDLGTDRYGRIVGRCRVGGSDMAEEIVRAGYAQAYRRYSKDYVDAEKAAVVAGRGIFRAEMEAPAVHRSAGSSPQKAPAGCAIKGNISKSGRIFHMPGQRDYARTRIDAGRGERWFCSEAEAVAAGWRRARG